MLEQRLCVVADTSIRDAISALVDGGRKVIFVIDAKMRLLGLFTTGDMRRYLLLGKSLSKPVSDAMNPTPITFLSVREVSDRSAAHPLIVYPIVDAEGKLVDALYPEDISFSESHELEKVPLVIMAGGKGTRLYPYTRVLPKAIIPIGNYSITERIIQSFYKYGCRHVYMVLNHRAAIIRAYMGEVDTGCEVEFVEESEFAGTAGGLALLKGKINSTFILSNCDILINDDLACAYLTHKEQKNQITFVCSMLDHTIPYGVVETSAEGRIQSITEKPHMSFLANTGVYVLEPCVFEEIRPGEHIDMTDLTLRCIQRGMRAGVFPISEKAWLDMGQIKDMEQMIQQLEPEE